MMRRTPLRRVSKKRQKLLAEYTKLRKTHLESNPLCFCGAEATDIHHRLSLGRGGKLTDTTIFLSVCRPCHNRIHQDPKWAEQNNYLWKNENSNTTKNRS